MSKQNGWIGVDFDACLAFYDHWRGPDHLGEPIAPMVERVKAWIADGREVRIVTARVAATDRVAETSGLADDRFFAEGQRFKIENWCEKHIGTRLQVTAQKDFAMEVLYDDRCIQVEKNTGRLVAPLPVPVVDITPPPLSASLSKIPTECDHPLIVPNKSAIGRLNRSGGPMDDTFIYMLRMHCAACGAEFSFKGIPVAPEDLDGAVCSKDGYEVHLAIAPAMGGLFPPKDTPSPDPNMITIERCNGLSPMQTPPVKPARKTRSRRISN